MYLQIFNIKKNGRAIKEIFFNNNERCYNSVSPTGVITVYLQFQHQNTDALYWDDIKKNLLQQQRMLL